jgi:peroxiredoxin
MSLTAAACGNAPGAQSADSIAPFELDLTSVDGRTLRLSELRGRPTLLFLFATYDGTSQLALTGLLRELEEREPLATVIGVAVQPDAKEFIEPFRKLLDVPFPLYMDTKSALLHGDTSVGKIPGVPAFIALDSKGYVRSTYYGVADRDRLHELIDSSL